MVCNLCQKNEAKVHLAQIVDGKTRKVDLCEACAKAKGLDDSVGFSLVEALTGGGGKVVVGGGKGEGGREGGGGVECGVCGYTQGAFKKTGRLGCSHCYEVFGGGLEKVFRSMHRGVRHVGKVPRVLRSGRVLEGRLGELADELRKAIEVEDFERAAVLRDELKEVRRVLADLALGGKGEGEGGKEVKGRRVSRVRGGGKGKGGGGRVGDGDGKGSRKGGKKEGDGEGKKRGGGGKGGGGVEDGEGGDAVV